MVSIEITQRESILLANDVALLTTLYRFSIEDLFITSCIEIPLVYLYEDISQYRINYSIDIKIRLHILVDIRVHYSEIT